MKRIVIVVPIGDATNPHAIAARVIEATKAVELRAVVNGIQPDAYWQNLPGGGWLGAEDTRK